MRGNLDPEIDLAVRAAKKGRAVNDTRQPLRNLGVEAQIRVDCQSTHAVTQQEARKIWPYLLEYCRDLVVELLNSETVGAAACREPKSFKVHQVDVEPVERKVDCCLKKYILALGESVNHGKRGMLLVLRNI